MLPGTLGQGDKKVEFRDMRVTKDLLKREEGTKKLSQILNTYFYTEAFANF